MEIAVVSTSDLEAGNRRQEPIVYGHQTKPFMHRDQEEAIATSYIYPQQRSKTKGVRVV
jgi:hypothetical protein